MKNDRRVLWSESSVAGAFTNEGRKSGVRAFLEEERMHGRAREKERKRRSRKKKEETEKRKNGNLKTERERERIGHERFTIFNRAYCAFTFL